MKVYGIDFTSSPSKKKPITFVECAFDQKTLHVEKLLKIDNFPQFESVLHEDDRWICVIDFPFGQSRKLIQNMGCLFPGKVMLR